MNDELLEKLKGTSSHLLESLRAVAERNIKHYQDHVLPNETFDLGVKNEKRQELQGFRALVTEIDRIQNKRLMEYLGK